jgi:hypothetical protein
MVASGATFTKTLGVDGLTVGPRGLASRDLQSAQLAANRLAQYAHYAGYNGVFLAADAVDDSITAAVTDAVATDAAGPPTVDPFELFFRTFDREGLQLLPTFELNRTTIERSQQFLVAYGNHASLGGIMVRLTSAGLDELIGSESAPDDATLRRFERDAGVSLSIIADSTQADRRATLLIEHRATWQRWRTTQVAARLHQLTKLTQAGDPRRRLIVSAGDLFSDAELRWKLRPALLHNADVVPILLEMGIDVQQLVQIPGLVFLQPHLIAPAAPLVDRAIDLEINSAATAIGRLTGGTAAGAMFFHRGHQSDLASIDDEAPLAANAVNLSVLSVPVADGAAARQPLLRGLGAQDLSVIVDSGIVPAVGQEDALRTQRSIVRWLPAGVPSQQVPAAQPVVVRSYQRSDDTTLAVINDSPWAVTVRLALEMPRACAVQIGPEPATTPTADEAAATIGAGSQSWLVELEPYDLVAARFGAPNVEVTDVQVEVAPEVKQALAQRIDQLRRRDKTSADACVYAVLTNPGFEPLGGETPAQPVAGWRTIIPGPDGAVGYSATDPLVGRTCLVMEADAQPVGVQSEPIRTPPTGQLALAVFVKAAGVTPETQVRIVFETVDGAKYRQFTVLTGAEPRERPLDDKWGYYVFGADDLPLSSDSEMVVRFELFGPGRVWIDSLQLNSLLFPFNHYAQSVEQRFALLKLIRAADNALEKDDLADCQDLLDGYWPRFVEEYLPLVEPPATPITPHVAEETAGDAPPAAEEPRPTISGRVRRWLWPY